MTAKTIFALLCLAQGIAVGYGFYQASINDSKKWAIFCAIMLGGMFMDFQFAKTNYILMGFLKGLGL